MCLYQCQGYIHLGLSKLMVIVVVHECILCLWVVFGRSFVQLYFGSVYIVVLDKIFYNNIRLNSVMLGVLCGNTLFVLIHIT